ncbi:MAG: T9SS type A sorting domain-containing protein [Melioribacteraceae bacterium]|nr:T9SS type A sorting domain-containing protein [Melioribacteraceae bacterium]
MKRILPSFILVLMLVISFSLTHLVYDSGKEIKIDRKTYTAWLAEHPFNNRQNLSESELRSIPKYDRPDLANELNFLMTVDPALGYVPYERIFKAYDIADAYRSLNKIASVGWEERGPDNFGGRIRALMFDPNDGTNKKLWAGGVAGGLWYTNDITVPSPTWNAINDFWDNIAVSCITYDPSNTNIFYAGTGEGWYNADAVRGQGIWKSTNGGTSWTYLSSTSGNEFDYVNDILVHPTTGDVYAAVRSRFSNTGGLYRSTNGGTSWEVVLNPTTSPTASSTYRAADLEIGADNKIYVAMGMHFYEDGIYGSYSGDPGAWMKLSDGSFGFPSSGFYRIELATAPSDANIVYALVESSSTSSILGLYKSTDKGTNWTTIATPSNADPGIPTFTRGQAWYDLICEVDPSNPNIVYAGGVDLFKSTNGGTSWSQISHWYGGFGFPYVHADQHNIAFRPGSSTEIAFANDGGIHYSTNGGVSFSEKNSGLNITQFYSCAMHPSAGSNYFLGGTQDNGSHQFTSAGINSTTEVTGGDGGFSFIDQSDPNYQITSYTRNNWNLSTNGGSSFSTLLSEGSGLFINPADYDDDANILYAARDASSIKRISNVTTSPSASNVSISLGATASHIRASQYSSHTIFIGTQAGLVYKVTNANGSPSSSNITGGSFPIGNVSCIELGSNENHILVTFSNYGVTSVWETTNGGSSWSNKEGNLPDMPVRWALYNPSDYSQVYLATEVGVWVTNDITAGSPVWVPSNTGLANVRVDMLQHRASDDYIAAATHGRGLFTSTSPVPVELSNFSASIIEDKVELNWTTTTETNNSGFEIQKFENNSWSKLDFVEGAGNSSTVQNYNFIDELPGVGKVNYRLKQIDFDGTFTYSNLVEVEVTAPQKFVLEQNYPNPFNPTTTIKFSLPEADHVSVAVYDILGSKVADLINEELSAGKHTVQWSGINSYNQKAASGTYIYIVKYRDQIHSKKMVLLK